MEINSAAARDLNSGMLKYVLAKPLLCLTVRTYPELEENRALMGAPPRRSESDCNDYNLFASSRGKENVLSFSLFIKVRLQPGPPSRCSV